MATLALQEIVATGLEDTKVAADAGLSDVVANDGRVFLEVDNAGGSDCVVTVPAVSNCSAGVKHDKVTTVTLGEARKIGPFDPNIYNNANGQITINYDQVSSVTIGALHLPDYRVT